MDSDNSKTIFLLLNEDLDLDIEALVKEVHKTKEAEDEPSDTRQDKKAASKKRGTKASVH